ncbi:MAG: hypothetical protein WCX95_04775 [Candidatus Gracilibacteria bacterium]
MVDVLQGDQGENNEEEAVLGMDVSGDFRGSDAAEMVRIRVSGRSFLVEERAISDLAEGVLDSLRITREDKGRSLDRYSPIETISGLTGGFKRRVQGLIHLRESIERENGAFRADRRWKDDRIAGRHKKISSARKSSKEIRVMEGV